MNVNTKTCVARWLLRAWADRSIYNVTRLSPLSDVENVLLPIGSRQARFDDILIFAIHSVPFRVSR